MRGSADETEQLPDGVKDRAWCHRRQLSLNGKPKSLAAVARRESWLADRHPAPEMQGTEEAAFLSRRRACVGCERKEAAEEQREKVCLPLIS